VIETLLVLGCLFLIGKSSVIIRNRINFKGLSTFGKANQVDLSVAVCIPARNEEKVIGTCIDSVLTQSYPNLHVYVLNDRSEDNTAEIIHSSKVRFGDNLTVLQGSDRPVDWLGKPWACHQLGLVAKADIVVFLDADTWLEPDAISRIVRAMETTHVDFVTVWPQQHTRSFWEKTIVPMVYYALLGFLPVKYSERKPRWMPTFFHNRFRSLFAAACGQCMAFRMEAYWAIGGHEAVKDKIVEDVSLARLILQQGFRMRMYHGMQMIHCRMYRNQQELFSGFRKNFLAGFDNNIPLFLLMSVLHLIAYIFPILVLVASICTPVSEITISIALLNILIMISHRVLLARWFAWSSVFSFLHPVGVIWFQLLGIRVLIDYFTGSKVSWKGENVNLK